MILRARPRGGRRLRLIMGVLGYALRKFSFDPAPLVLGLVIAPLFEQSLRQSLIMSNGDYLIFFSRPISFGLLIVCAIMLTLSAIALALKRKDWRATLAEAEAGEVRDLRL
jgi:putative tricarboxylic transport membrane protein